MATYIVAARIDENGKARGGAAGDQTAREVCKQTLSGSGSWSKFYRPPHSAAKIAANALAIAANENIGYDQSNRLSLDTAAQAVNYDFSKVGPCECDCSSLVAADVRACGFNVPATMYTGNEGALLEAAGFKGCNYSAAALKVGDVLWRSGHTAIVVSTTNGSQQSTPSTPSNSAGLAVDGEWGKNTTKALQRYLGTPVDGIVSGQRVAYRKVWPSCLASSWQFVWAGKSQMIQALQKLIGVAADGVAGPNTCKALQKRLGVSVDGVFGPKSVKALQTALNKGKI